MVQWLTQGRKPEPQVMATAAPPPPPLVSLGDRLRLAASRGELETVQELLQLGASLEPDRDGRTVLHLAAQNGQAEVTKVLINAGCDINAVDSLGGTPLHRAAAQGHVEVVTLLLEEGCAYDRQEDVHGNTALHEAAWNGFSDTIKALIKGGANIFATNKAGFGPLHLAAQNGHNQSTRELLYSGCSADDKNNYGDTCLHTAARYGHAGVTRIALSAKCNANEQNKNGDTALHIAAALRRRKIAKLLVEAGVNSTIKNKQNETPIDVARRKEHPEIIVIITAPPKKPKHKAHGSHHPHHHHSSRHHHDRSGVSSPGAEVMVDGPVSDKEKEKEKGKFSFFKKKKVKEKSGHQQQHVRFQDEVLKQQQRQQAGQRALSPTQGLFGQYVPKAGTVYYKDLAGNIKQGPIGYAPTCTQCVPMIKKLGDKVEVDKQNLYDHIDSTQKTLTDRIDNLEKKTALQVHSLDKFTRERLEAEKLECQKRLENRVVQERLEIDNELDEQQDIIAEELKTWMASRLGPGGRFHDDTDLPVRGRVNRTFHDQHLPNGFIPGPGPLVRSRSDETLSQSEYGKHKRNLDKYKHKLFQELRALKNPLTVRDRPSRRDQHGASQSLGNLRAGSPQRQLGMANSPTPQQVQSFQNIRHPSRSMSPPQHSNQSRSLSPLQLPHHRTQQHNQQQRAMSPPYKLSDGQFPRPSSMPYHDNLAAPTQIMSQYKTTGQQRPGSVPLQGPPPPHPKPGVPGPQPTHPRPLSTPVWGDGRDTRSSQQLHTVKQENAGQSATVQEDSSFEKEIQFPSRGQRSYSQSPTRNVISSNVTQNPGRNMGQNVHRPMQQQQQQQHQQQQLPSQLPPSQLNRNPEQKPQQASYTGQQAPKPNKQDNKHFYQPPQPITRKPVYPQVLPNQLDQPNYQQNQQLGNSLIHQQHIQMGHKQQPSKPGNLVYDQIPQQPHLQVSQQPHHPAGHQQSQPIKQLQDSKPPQQTQSMPYKLGHQPQHQQVHQPPPHQTVHQPPTRQQLYQHIPQLPSHQQRYQHQLPDEKASQHPTQYSHASGQQQRHPPTHQTFYQPPPQQQTHPPTQQQVHQPTYKPTPLPRPSQRLSQPPLPSTQPVAGQQNVAHDQHRPGAQSLQNRHPQGPITAGRSTPHLPEDFMSRSRRNPINESLLKEFEEFETGKDPRLPRPVQRNMYPNKSTLHLNGDNKGRQLMESPSVLSKSEPNIDQKSQPPSGSGDSHVNGRVVLTREVLRRQSPGPVPANPSIPPTAYGPNGHQQNPVTLNHVSDLTALQTVYSPSNISPTTVLNKSHEEGSNPDSGYSSRIYPNHSSLYYSRPGLSPLAHGVSVTTPPLSGSSITERSPQSSPATQTSTGTSEGDPTHLPMPRHFFNAPQNPQERWFERSDKEETKMKEDKEFMEQRFRSLEERSVSLGSDV
ncbi:trithorax group protein osa isoform X2 [Lingula anatina]|uniref:Trithorax group protein osa isoform X2 n=1 Tax=Lingula anatina TaxID=7574 RepID=A0A1S3HB53_LINAN|nr:trithorax group protein osa isoform X2 [Lingula anatina]|eukprot:XP_013383238.1 trithorax group protein osa isoform X2 [Lingula anatina]